VSWAIDARAHDPDDEGVNRDAPIRVRAAVDQLAGLLKRGRFLALTGAGISTESGIPDYRGPESAKRDHRPMRYQEFVRSPGARKRYWARSSLGWSSVARAAPNDGHRALARLQRVGAVAGVLTQNVDGLHQRAGSHEVLELHGTLAEVRCLACGRPEARTLLQRRLGRLNPGLQRTPRAIAPDGDAEVPAALIERFVVPSCLLCRGVLKPAVVFFGENVPRERVERAWTMLDHAEGLLVLGSSLTVFSGYRFVARAAEQGKPVVIVNDGPTRGDAAASLKLEGRLGALLPALANDLAPPG
jgi:NAD-dependent SIR2 family protein deacetylase